MIRMKILIILGQRSDSVGIRELTYNSCDKFLTNLLTIDHIEAKNLIRSQLPVRRSVEVQMIVDFPCKWIDEFLIEIPVHTVSDGRPFVGELFLTNVSGHEGTYQ